MVKKVKFYCPKAIEDIDDDKTQIIVDKIDVRSFWKIEEILEEVIKKQQQQNEEEELSQKR